jgi:hypothetical protein
LIANGIEMGNGSEFMLKLATQLDVIQMLSVKFNVDQPEEEIELSQEKSLPLGMQIYNNKIEEEEEKEEDKKQ